MEMPMDSIHLVSSNNEFVIRQGRFARFSTLFPSPGGSLPISGNRFLYPGNMLYFLAQRVAAISDASP